MKKREFAVRLLFWLLPWPISKALPRALRIYYFGPGAGPPPGFYDYWGVPKWFWEDIPSWEDFLENLPDEAPPWWPPNAPSWEDFLDNLPDEAPPWWPMDPYNPPDPESFPIIPDGPENPSNPYTPGPGPGQGPLGPGKGEVILHDGYWFPGHPYVSWEEGYWHAYLSAPLEGFTIWTFLPWVNGYRPSYIHIVWSSDETGAMNFWLDDSNLLPNHIATGIDVEKDFILPITFLADNIKTLALRGTVYDGTYINVNLIEFL